MGVKAMTVPHTRAGEALTDSLSRSSQPLPCRGVFEAFHERGSGDDFFAQCSDTTCHGHVSSRRIKKELKSVA